MLNTKALQKLKPSFLHRAVHAPEPLSRQQTQQFLDTLTTSFRRNLDEEHGWPTQRTENSPRASIKSRQRNAARHGARTAASEPSIPHSNGRGFRHWPPTDHHVSSVLSNPLFRPAPAAPTAPGTKRDPMDVFDEAVAKGLMTIPIAAGCLEAKRTMIVDSPWTPDEQASATSDSTSDFHVAHRVLDWLRSSGMDETLTFSTSERFIRALMPFVEAEGHEAVMWDWIVRLMPRSGIHNVHAAKRILTTLVQRKAYGNESLEGAVELVIRVSETYRDDPRHATLLTPAWRYVAWKLSSPFWRKHHLSASVYDAYLGVADYLDPGRVELLVANLHLHHPVTPTHDRALKYFDLTSKTGGTKAEGSMPEAPWKEANMGVDTANHLGLIGEFGEARRLMNLIRKRYSTLFDDDTLYGGDGMLERLAPA